MISCAKFGRSVHQHCWAYVSKEERKSKITASRKQHTPAQTPTTTVLRMSAQAGYASVRGLPFSFYSSLHSTRRRTLTGGHGAAHTGRTDGQLPPPVRKTASFTYITAARANTWESGKFAQSPPGRRTLQSASPAGCRQRRSLRAGLHNGNESPAHPAPTRVEATPQHTVE